MSLPTGTVTFLFTDIEGSTRLWEQHPEVMHDALHRHNALLSQNIAAYDGVVFKTVGDAFCAAFASAPAALTAALASQQALQQEPWPTDVILRVRMALHTGTVDERDGDYFGPPLNRVARLLSAGYGGQTLFSQTTYDLTRDSLPVGATLQDLGAHSLRDLTRPEQVYQLVHPNVAAEFPLLKSLDSLPNNLPQQMTSFIGRDKELDQVKDLLSKTRLLTLTGSGGAGKTRLSLQAAADVLDNYPDGAWLVELAPITDSELVPQTVASVLGVKEQPGKTFIQVLTDYLKAKTLLLVLDNCEHVLDATAKLADTLLRSCPQVKILASSREGLGIAGELTYRVPSLSLPDAKTATTAVSISSYEAVQLFVERALFHKPDFAVTNANAPALASVCHRLDGIPLAIELASARIRSLSVEEINSKLDNRFRLLTGGSRTALPRQQTLRALIDWSYGLLTDQEKHLLTSLSVFAGGWSLSSAEAVCAGEDIEDWEVLDLLTSLVDKSLVTPDEAEGQTRYRFLETVRQYARDRLAESAENLDLRGRHRDYFLQIAQETKPKLTGPEQVYWLSVLETEHDNLRQALTFCLEELDGAEKGLQIGAYLQEFWQTRGHLREGRERLTALLSRPEAQPHTQVRADALNSAGTLASLQGDPSVTRSHFEESLAISRELGNKQGIATSLMGLANVFGVQGNLAMARPLFEESLALSQELGNKQDIASALGVMGIAARDQGDYALSEAKYGESLSLYRELGNKRGINWALMGLGIVARLQGDTAAARLMLEEGLEISRELGDKQNIAAFLNILGSMSKEQGDYAVARPLFEESMALSRELGDKYGIASSLNVVGAMAQEQGDYALAWSRYEESLSLYRDLATKHGIAIALSNLGTIARLQGNHALSQSLQEESLSLYRDLGNKKGVASSLLSLGNVARLQGDSAAARFLYDESLSLNQELGNKQGIATSLNNLGNVAYDQGDYAASQSLHQQSLAIRRELGNKMGIALSLNNLGNVAYEQHESGIAWSLYEESLSVYRKLGRKLGIANALSNLGNVANNQSDYVLACANYDESLLLYREIGNKRDAVNSLLGLGDVARKQGDYMLARSMFEESLTMSRDLKNKQGIAASFEAFAALFVKEGNAERAARLWGASEALREGMGTPLPSSGRTDYARHVAMAREALGDERFASVWAEGRAMSIELAVDHALVG